MRAVVGVAAGLAVLALGVWLGAGPARAVPPSSEAGADIAARWCAACHVVSPSGAGIDAAPSFPAIAHQRGTDEVRAFLAKPHGKPMRGFDLSNREIDDVVAYIATLDQPAER
jgi:mono/diheme cytochrome c family protein